MLKTAQSVKHEAVNSSAESVGGIGRCYHIPPGNAKPQLGSSGGGAGLSLGGMIEELVPTSDAVIVYTDNYYAVFDKLDYTDMVLAVPEATREKLRELIKRKRSRSRVTAATDGSP